MEKIKVILADDHVIVRNGIKTLLENQSEIDVIGEASNGKEAIEISNKLNPDVIIMDIKMPEMTGIEATKEILQRSSETRVLILSMHDLEDYVIQAVESGAAGYLLKDAGQEEFLKAIRKVNNNEQYYSSDIAHVFVNKYLNKGGSNKEELSTQFNDLGITRREKQILKYLLNGYTNKEIAQELEKSVRTIETHRFNIMKKLNVHNSVELLKAVEEYHLLD